MSMHRKLLPLLAAAAIGCGSDTPTGGTGPVTVRFATPTYPTFTGSGRDTAFAIVVLDQVDTAIAPIDSFMNVSRGLHTFTARLDNEYLAQTFSWPINPPGSVAVVPIGPAPSCRVFVVDDIYCLGRNYVFQSAHRIYCPAGDFGAFCAYRVDAFTLGGTWPSDVAASAENEYIGHAKLLIAARVGSAGGERAAMAFLDDGDYLPRRRHHVKDGDSTLWQAVAWTDGRHVPVFPDSEPTLSEIDRVDVTFGLQVRTTYLINPNEKDVLFVRWDIVNVSDSADYRRVHPEMPVGGRTLYNIWLSPVVDPDVGGIRIVGGNTIDDQVDDNGTVFPAESLAVAWDQEFEVPAFGGGWSNRPGLVGVRLLEGPPGAKALILDGETPLRYLSTTDEDQTYAVLAGGRDGGRTGCTDLTDAFLCMQTGNSENEHDIRIGWSVGPIAQLAPGESTSLQVAIIIASPVIGSYTSGTGVPPVNSDLSSTSRTIYTVAGALRAIADRIKTMRVPDQTF